MPENTTIRVNSYQHKLIKELKKELMKISPMELSNGDVVGISLYSLINRIPELTHKYIRDDPKGILSLKIIEILKEKYRKK